MNGCKANNHTFIACTCLRYRPSRRLLFRSSQVLRSTMYGNTLKGGGLEGGGGEKDVIQYMSLTNMLQKQSHGNIYSGCSLKDNPDTGLVSNIL